MKNNIVYKWTNRNDKPKPEWPHPERTVAKYHQSMGGDASAVAFLNKAALRPLKTLWPEYSARVKNEYFRKGFNLAATDNKK